jgi:hypothetical protein
VPDLLADQHIGRAIAWALGEIPMVIVLVALLARWVGADAPEARQPNHKAETTSEVEIAGEVEIADKGETAGEVEPATHNALLTRLVNHRPARDHEAR